MKWLARVLFAMFFGFILSWSCECWNRQDRLALGMALVASAICCTLMDKFSEE